MTSFLDQTYNKRTLLALCFFIPFAILAILYIFMGVYPFGDQTLLTVDLGQQYVDFYRYYRHTLLHEPEALFYSFEKGIGGEMIGLWSYYLNSPFNLLFLLFPDSLLPVGVTVNILLKLSMAGWSFGYLLVKKYEGNTLAVPLFAVSYALMGYALANQLNVMWLDGLVFLPLIIYGLERLVDGKKGIFYSLFLSLMLVANYYIGYMICLFVVLYFIYALVKKSHFEPLNVKQSLRYYGLTTARFAGYSILAGGFAAFSLLPNFYSLLNGKASYVSDVVDWSLKYPIEEIVSKFYIGAFDFDQMPSGLPNLFIGTIALVSFFYYFVQRSFPLRERIVAGLLTGFFVISMNSNYLNKIWHGMQYPIWYPYRFSFVVCFFLLIIGFRSFQKNNVLPLWFACLLLVAQVVSAVYVLQKEFSYVVPIQVAATVGITIIVLALFLLRGSKYKWLPTSLLVLTVVEMSANAAIDLTRLSYVRMNPFVDYQTVLDEWIEPIRPDDSTFYRIEKVFQRSKNDSFQANYPSATHFSSTFEKSVPTFYGLMGFPDGNGFVSYSTGTLFTDALFGIRYYGEDVPLPESLTDASELYHIRRNSNRPDLTHYPIVESNDRTQTRQNPYAFSLGFAAPEKIKNVVLQEDQPIDNQERMMHALSNTFFENPFYQTVPLQASVANNVASHLTDSYNRTYYKDNLDEDASMEFQFTTYTADPFYLVLDESIDDDISTFERNGEEFQYYKTYRNDQILNLASGNPGETVRFRFNLLEDTLTIRDLALYQFNHSQFEVFVEERKQAGMLEIEEFSQNEIKGTITVGADNDVFLTTIPYSKGWTIEIDGEKVETFETLGIFLASEISEGTHAVTLSYRPPFLKEGIIVTLGSALIALFIWADWKRIRKTLRLDKAKDTR